MAQDKPSKILNTSGNDSVPLKASLAIAAYLIVATILLFISIAYCWPECGFEEKPGSQPRNSNQNKTDNVNRNLNQNTSQPANANANRVTNRNSLNLNLNGNANSSGNESQNSNQSSTGDKVSITSVAPTSGPTSGDTRVTIKGSGFEEGATARFDETPASVIDKVMPGEITVKTPAHLQGTVNVTVRNAGGEEGTLPAAYTYTCSDPFGRTLILIIILVGALGGTIHGIRSLFWYIGNRELCWSWVPMYILLPFNGAAMALIFFLIIRGGFISTIDRGSSLALIAIAALVGLFSQQAALKLGDIANAILTKPGEGKDSKPQRSETSDTARKDMPPGGNKAPKIEPNAGPAGGGTKVKITGTGFSSVKEVSFGNEKVSGPDVRIDTTTGTITLQTPPNPAGPVDVIVTDNNGKTAGPMKFTYE